MYVWHYQPSQVLGRAIPKPISEDTVKVGEQKEGEEWILKKILGSKKRKGDSQVYYQFKWKDDDQVYENVWED